MRAYNIETMAPPVHRADPDDKGWCFGLPTSITAEQWPLDPANGYPPIGDGNARLDFMKLDWAGG